MITNSSPPVSRTECKIGKRTVKRRLCDLLVMVVVCVCVYVFICVFMNKGLFIEKSSEILKPN